MTNYKRPVFPSNSLPRVVIIGSEDELNLHSSQFAEYEATELNVIQLKNDDHIDDVLAHFNPDAIITIGKESSDFPGLYRQSIDVRRRWIHLEQVVSNLGDIAYQCASQYILTSDYEETPLISFFTPMYNTGETLLKTYESVKNQLYTNWEWVLVNDSTDEGFTYEIAEKIAVSDCRVKLYDFKKKSGGIVGEAKYRAAALCKGRYLMELDHDDYVLPEAGYLMVAAFKKYPDCKFVYSDCAEIDVNHNSLGYGDDFALGYGSYKEETYHGVRYQVINAPNINPKTIRHIVGIPNHFRAWDRVFYHSIGGHNRRLTIADDYELVIRTFLKTKMVRIPKLLYLQFHHESNTHHLTRKDIQRRVRTIREYYNEKIHQRFLELGVEDWAYSYADPVMCPSRFGAEENAVNYTFI